MKNHVTISPVFGWLLAAALLFASAASGARDYKLGEIEIGHPYARGSVPGQRNGSAYLSLKNGGAADRLLAATSPMAASVELHTMRMDGDVMRMRQLDSVELAPGARFEFKPGAHHLMLMGLKQPLKRGERFELTLEFEKAGKLTVQVMVEDTGQAGPAAHRH